MLSDNYTVDEEPFKSLIGAVIKSFAQNAQFLN